MQTFPSTVVATRCASSSGSGRLHYLDVLRGFAICGVVVVHVGQVVPALPGPLSNLTGYGARGVQLFFVVSALTFALVTDVQSFSAPAFFVKRFFRIAPAYYIGIVLSLVLLGGGASYYAPAGLSWKQVLLNILFLHGFSQTAVNSVVPGGWSIACEWMFYLAFPVILVIVTNFGRAVVGFVLSIFVAATALILLPRIFHFNTQLQHDWLFFSIIVQAPAFAGGLLVAYFIRCAQFSAFLAHHQKLMGLMFWAAATTMLGLAVLGGRAHHHLLAIPLMIVLVVATSSTRVPWIPDKLLANLGQVSFSMYILQSHAIRITSDAIRPLDLGAGTMLMVCLGISFVLTYLLAKLSYTFVETPGIALGRKMAARWLK